MLEALNRELEGVLRRWPAVIAAQDAALVAQVEHVVHSGRTEDLASLEADPTEAADLIQAAMVDLAAVAGRQVSQEALDQGVTVHAKTPAVGVLEDAAMLTAALLAKERAVSAARAAQRALGTGAGPKTVANAASPQEVGQAVAQHLDSLSSANAEAQIGGALHGSMNAGRYATLADGPVGALYAQEMNDSHTCGPCRQVKGRWLGNTDELDRVFASYPGGAYGGYIDCEGGVRCRGTITGVWRKGSSGPPPAAPPAGPQPAPKPAPAKSAELTPIERAHQHVDRIMDVPDSQRQIIGDELHRQADLIPHTMLRLPDLVMSKLGTAEADRYLDSKWGKDYGIYNVINSQIRLNPLWADPQAGFDETSRGLQRSGWYVPRGDLPAVGGTVAHEVGHLLTGGLDEPVDTGLLAMRGEVADQLMPVLAQALGIEDRVLLQPARWGEVDPDTGQLKEYSLSYEQADRWVVANAAVIRDKISDYAARGDMSELLAEVWAEYSRMGAQARPWIQTIGRHMQQLAEQERASVAPATAPAPQVRPDQGRQAPEQISQDHAQRIYGFADPKTGLVAEVDHVANLRTGDNEPYTVLDLVIRDASGAKIGSATRTYDPVTATMTHNSFGLEPGFQGTGFASRWAQQVEAQYRAMGVHEIRLLANIDVGGYAWARAGYDFADPESRAAVIRRFGESLPSRPKEIVAEFRRLAADPQVTPLELAMLGWHEGATTWPGKWIMLGSRWEAVKVL